MLAEVVALLANGWKVPELQLFHLENRIIDLNYTLLYTFSEWHPAELGACPRL